MEVKICRLCQPNNDYIFYQMKNGDKFRKNDYLNMQWLENSLGAVIGYVKSDFKDNIEDLLIVGDIVHYVSLNFKDGVIIRGENALRVIREDVKSNEMEITAIELAENRKPQKIGESE